MPAIGGRNPISIQYLDNSSEVQSIRLYAGELTAVSLPGFLTGFGTLQAALDGVTLGTRSAQTWGEETTVSNTPPADKNAQVETEMLVRVRGATTEAPWSFRIPTADYTAFNFVEGTDKAIISGAGASAATTALVTALEALCKMPNDETEAIVVVGMNVVK